MELKQNNLLVKIAYLPNAILNTWGDSKKETLIQVNFWVFCFKLIISPILTPFMLVGLGITFIFLFMVVLILIGVCIVHWTLGFMFTYNSVGVEYKKWPTIVGRRIYPAFLLLFLPIICFCIGLYSGNESSLELSSIITIIINVTLIIVIIFWKTVLTFLMKLKKYVTSERFIINMNRKGENNEKKN